MRSPESKQNKKFRERIKAQRLHGLYLNRRIWVGLPKRLRSRRCCGRVRFPHQHHAVARAANIVDTKGTLLHARPCLCCMGWHLTRNPRLARDWAEAIEDAMHTGYCLVPG